MLQDEFDRLMELFQAAADGKSVNLEQVFRQSIGFFERLKEKMAKGTPEEKLQAIHLMTQMYQKMQGETGKIAKHSGMSEEQLMEYAKNPSNFTPEQWDNLQASQSQLKHLGEDIVHEMKRSVALPAQKKEGPKKTTKEKGVKKADWFRS